MSDPDMDVNDLLSADEQSDIGRAAILAHFEATWAELQSTIMQLKERPELVTREHVHFYRDAIRQLMQWLRANGIEVYAHVHEASGIDVEPGDKL